jgi:glycosyltransferase involved in cell wall biosynthesis
LVRGNHPDARLLVVGFGALEKPLRNVVDGFAAGELAPLRELAERGWGLEEGEEGPLRMLTAFLDDLPVGYADAVRAAAHSIHFAGRLEHDEVAVPVAASDALVFPSTFPEAFGMVAAEAAAAGVLPVSAAHSGAAEVSHALAAELPEAARSLLSFALDDEAVEAIAARIDGWLGLGGPDRELASEALRNAVERLWSWDGVARTVLAASAGELEGLLLPAAD